MFRENLSFEIGRNERGHACIIPVDDEEVKIENMQREEMKEMMITPVTASTIESSVPTTTADGTVNDRRVSQSTTRGRVGNRPHLELRSEEDGKDTKATTAKKASTSPPTKTTAAGTATRGPHIFVQDDDPEYMDYDEEDPDDDLDI